MTVRQYISKWRYLLLALMLGLSSAAFAAIAVPLQAYAQEVSARPVDIEVFVREGCPHCAKAEAFLMALKQEQPELRIVIHDVLREPAGLDRLKRIAEHHGATTVPTFVVNGKLISGYSDEANTGQLIRDSLAGAGPQTHASVAPLAGCETESSRSCKANTPVPALMPQDFELNIFGRSLSLDQVGLPLFTLAMGLLDGFNPCSMWVLILMLSLLAPIKNRFRMFAIAGTFVAVEGIAYFVFMAAWLNLFLLIGYSHTSELIIAAIALLVGAINIKDFWAFGWGISLSIPAAAKPAIYARIRNILQAENLAAAIFGAVVLACLVQIAEFMCTSGFPALFTRILTLKKVDGLSYYGYLALYDLAYMLDDLVILSIGIITLSQRRLHEKEGRWLKLISGLAMVGLGIYLLLHA